MKIAILFLGIVLSNYLLAADADTPCSEHAATINNITGSVMTHILPVETIGGVNELTYLDKSRTLFYRNQRNELLSKSFVDGSTETQFEGLEKPLAHALDPLERYLSLDGNPWVFNIQQKAWQSWGEGPSPFALFWTHPPTPRLIAAEKIVKRTQTTYRLYSYEPKSNQLNSCLVDSMDAERFRIARGDTDGYVYFYWPEYYSWGIKVRFVVYQPVAGLGGLCRPWFGPWAINVEQPQGTKLLDLYEYGHWGATAMTFDNPSKPVVIHYPFVNEAPAPADRQGKCFVYRTQNQKPILATSKEPSVLAWGPSTGLSIYNLKEDSGTRVDFLNGFTVDNLDPKRVWTIPNSNTVLVAPDVSFQATRTIYKVSIVPNKH